MKNIDRIFQTFPGVGDVTDGAAVGMDSIVGWLRSLL
jgi:hypothetical protein